MVKSLGNTCTDDYYCRQSVSQSHCYNGKCSCINGYISLDFINCIQSNSKFYIKYYLNIYIS
jgi:hypothetical protein